jgi:hypothetical protein
VPAQGAENGRELAKQSGEPQIPGITLLMANHLK